MTTSTKKPYHKKRHPWKNQDLRSDDKRKAIGDRAEGQKSGSESETVAHRLSPAMVPLPRRPLVEKMCATCPFNKDRGAPKLKISDDDFAAFKQQALVGEFYCHETVLEDPRTLKDDQGNAVGIQSHFKVCRGAWELKLANIRRRTT